MSAITDLIEALKRLPSVGNKSAQRMAFHLLERDREAALKLARALQNAVEKVGHCRSCRTLSETELCAICANPQRQTGELCIVETPADLQAIESATHFRGQYFVLHGRLSPIDGLGPKQLGFELLIDRFASGAISELIIATNPTVEGEATAHYLAELAKTAQVRVSRIAHGVPVGGELEYIDRTTLAHAFGGRITI
jgi:recombination protein RecR